MHKIKYLLFLALRPLKIKVRKKIGNTGVVMDLCLSQFIDFWIFADGTYEGEYIEYIENNYRGGVFMDVGANIGIYSLVLSGSMQKVYAFEPARESYKRLQRAVEVNKIININVYEKAVGEVDGKKVKLFQNADHGSRSVAYNVSGKYDYVRTICLDKFVIGENIERVDFIKIDIEGAEYDALLGSIDLVRKYKPDFLIEMNSALYKACGKNMEELYVLMASFGYKAYVLDRGRRRKVDWIYLKDSYNNVLFLKD